MSPEFRRENAFSAFIMHCFFLKIKVFALNEQILNIKQEIGDLKVSLVETGVDVGPAIYLARTFNTDIDTVTKFFIFILIFVFDPMAVSLVIAYNVIVIDRQKEIVIRENKKIIMVEEKHNEEKPNYKKKESKT